MAININQKGKRAVLHFTGTGSANLVGNSTTCDIAISDEEIGSCFIRKVWWGCSTGNWTVARGGNTVLVLPSSGTLDLSTAPITGNATSNLVCTLSAGAGFIMVEVSKN